MKIDFFNVIPAPIPEKDIANSEIWSRNFSLSSSNNYLIYAESGKGKTTFVNIIFGLRKDYSGKVLIDSNDTTKLNKSEYSELRKKSLSIVPQGLQLFNELTLIENLQIKNKLTNFQSEEIIRDMISTLGLSGMENKPVGKMSFGQRQRVAIMRALCQPFEFILLDEAFSHLDENNALKALELIKQEAKRQKAGIILTSLKDNYNDEFIKIRV